MTGLSKDRIVVPIDFSDESFAAIDTALEIANALSGIHAIHVLGELSPAEPGEIWGTIDHDTRSRHATQALRERLTGPNYGNIQIEIAFGDPARGIAEFAEEIGAELIIMPSHGRSGIGRLLIGSVAERTVRLAHCPVLVLRE